jgi:hypothetical protein
VVGLGTCLRTRKVNGAIVVGVHLVDHVLQLGLGGVLTQGAHHGAELLGRDLTIAIFVLCCTSRALVSEATKPRLLVYPKAIQTCDVE